MTQTTKRPLENYLSPRIRFFLAKRFGKKFVGTDSTQGGTTTRMHGYQWRGCTYITGCDVITRGKS